MHLRRCLPFGEPSLLVLWLWQAGHGTRAESGLSVLTDGVVFNGCGGGVSRGFLVGGPGVAAWLLLVKVYLL
jgi:hypothetical protein